MQKLLRYALMLFTMCTTSYAAWPYAYKTAIARYGQPKYAPHFAHFDTVNPNAPKGGTVRMGVIGTFNSTNPYVIHGTPPAGLSLVSERLTFISLMVRSPEEPFSLYPAIAEAVSIADDYSRMRIRLDPRARFHSGKHITATELLWTFNTLGQQGAMAFRNNYRAVLSAKIIDKRTVEFVFKKNAAGRYDPELPMRLCLMTVLDPDDFTTRKIDDVSLVPLNGNGPYEVAEIKPGHKITYRRRPDYWADDLNTMRGRYNFDYVEYRYYRDPEVVTQAFVAGDANLLMVARPEDWPRFKTMTRNANGPVTALAVRQELPSPLTGFTLNLRRAKFQDDRVRQALFLVFDFHWLNKNLYQEHQERYHSFYQYTPFASKISRPDIDRAVTQALGENFAQKLAELETEDLENRRLQPFSGAAFSEVAAALAQTSWRARFRQASALLKEAGYTLHQGRLIDPKTQQPVSFECIITQKAQEKDALTLKKALKKLGIDLRVKMLDAVQAEGRRKERNFDIIQHSFFCSTRSPGIEQQYYWHSQHVDAAGGRNISGVQAKSIDYVIDALLDAQSYRSVVALMQWLDATLMHQYFVIPLGHSPYKYMIGDARIRHPQVGPDVPMRLMNAWYAEDKDS